MKSHCLLSWVNIRDVHTQKRVDSIGWIRFQHGSGSEWFQLRLIWIWFRLWIRIHSKTESLNGRISSGFSKVSPSGSLSCRILLTRHFPGALKKLSKPSFPRDHFKDPCSFLDASVSPRLDMCQSSQQTTEMNASHSRASLWNGFVLWSSAFFGDLLLLCATM